MQSKFYFLTLTLILICQLILAQIPETISYQGILTTTENTVVSDGVYKITFKLYNTIEGGMPLWTETQSLEVREGIFNAALGSRNPLNIPFDQQYWLSIAIGEGPEFTKRMQLTTSPYSLNSRSVADSSITRQKIAKSQLVKSINSLTEDVNLVSGKNVSITRQGDSLVISASVEFDEKSFKPSNNNLPLNSPIRSESSKNPWKIKGNENTDPDVNFLGTIDSKPLILKTNSEEAVRIEVDGKVGIGTTTPTEILSVYGTIESSEGGFKFPDGTTQTTAATVGQNNNPSDPSAAIGGGTDNTASGESSTVPGGSSNTAAGDYSFAAGKQASALHDGTFVWSDATNTEFSSSASNQFIIRATGGVGIGTNDPTTALDVSGDIHASGIISIGNSIYLDGPNETITSSTGAVGFGDNDLLSSGVIVADGFQGDGSGLTNVTGTDDSKVAKAGDIMTGTLKFKDIDVDISTHLNQHLALMPAGTGNVGIGTINPSEKLEVVGRIKALSFEGNGSGLTNVSTNDLESGTYSNPYTFDNSANNFTGSFSGDGSGLTDVSTDDLAAGTYEHQYTFSNTLNDFTGSFSGDGSGLTDVSTDDLAAGTYEHQYTFSNVANSFNGSFTGDGSGLTDVPVSDLPGGLYPNQYTFSNTLNDFTGSFSGDGSGLTNVPVTDLPGGLYPNQYTFDN
ncbi:hypothetical protein ACFLSX_01615, partial [Calditrichota bacterium]